MLSIDLTTLACIILWTQEASQKKFGNCHVIVNGGDGIMLNMILYYIFCFPRFASDPLTHGQFRWPSFRMFTHTPKIERDSFTADESCSFQPGCQKHGFWRARWNSGGLLLRSSQQVRGHWGARQSESLTDPFGWRIFTKDIDIVRIIAVLFICTAWNFNLSVLYGVVWGSRIIMSYPDDCPKDRRTYSYHEDPGCSV